LVSVTLQHSALKPLPDQRSALAVAWQGRGPLFFDQSHSTLHDVFAYGGWPANRAAQHWLVEARRSGWDGLAAPLDIAETTSSGNVRFTVAAGSLGPGHDFRIGYFVRNKMSPESTFHAAC